MQLDPKKILDRQERNLAIIIVILIVMVFFMVRFLIKNI